MNTSINPHDAALEAALTAQNHLKREIAQHHVAIHKLAAKLEKVGGKMDYEESIIEILKVSVLPEDLSNRKPLEERKYSIHQADLANALGDPALLSAARAKLDDDKRIQVVPNKNRKILKLAPAEHPQAGANTQQDEFSAVPAAN